MKEKIQKTNNIIIVGSSDMVLQSELGGKIDEFETIIRFNRAPTEGFEKYVGSKTDIRFVNSHVVRNAPKQNEDLKFLPSLTNQTISSDYNITESEFYKTFKKSCKYKQVNRFHNYNKFKKTILKEIDFEYNSLPKEPSIGLGAILYYINNGFKPTIYGFHLHDENKNTSPHYWKNKPKVGGCHDFSFERKLIKNLIKNNYLKLLK